MIFLNKFLYYYLFFYKSHNKYFYYDFNKFKEFQEQHLFSEILCPFTISKNHLNFHLKKEKANTNQTITIF